MKYLRKYNESTSDFQFEHLMDNFSFINDTIGQPSVSKSKWGDSFKYRLVWDLGINIYELQKPSDVVGKLKTIIENFEDIVSAEERVSDFTIKMSIDHSKLIVEANPVSLGGDNYEFIKGQNWREIILNINELERYLNKNGITIKTKGVVDEVETTETTWVDIKTDEIPANVRRDLIERFNDELKSKTGEIDYNNNGIQQNIDREIELNVGQNFIKLYPIDSKTYIIF